MALWRIAVAAAAGIGWCYVGTRTSHTLAHGKAIPLAEMAVTHREAWRHILDESKVLREARRAFTPTGCAAYASLLKRRPDTYGIIAPPPNKYGPLIANIIAEPSDARAVPLLAGLPPAVAEHYKDEAKVLAGGGTDLAIINRLYGVD